MAPAKDELARSAWRQLTGLVVGEQNTNFFPRLAVRLGLTPGQLRALLGLPGDRGIPMRALAESMGCDASYATGLVDDLEAAGLVERGPSPTDRRVKLVHVTARGRAVQAEAIGGLTQPPASFDRLTAAQLKTLLGLLAEVVDEEAVFPPRLPEVRFSRPR